MSAPPSGETSKNQPANDTSAPAGAVAIPTDQTFRDGGWRGAGGSNHHHKPIATLGSAASGPETVLLALWWVEESEAAVASLPKRSLSSLHLVRSLAHLANAVLA